MNCSLENILAQLYYEKRPFTCSLIIANIILSLLLIIRYLKKKKTNKAHMHTHSTELKSLVILILASIHR